MAKHNPKGRPTGVTIVAILLILGFLWGLFLAVFTIASPAVMVLVVLAVAKLIACWGLWTMRRWAYALTMIISLAEIAVSVYAYFFASFTLFGAAVGVVLSLLVVILLLALKDIRAALG